MDLSTYDGVIVGASVHTGSHDHSISDFVRDNLPVLERIPSVFFSVSLIGSSQKPGHRAQIQAVLNTFSAQTGWHPSQIGVFGGAARYSRYNVLSKFVMKRIVKHYDPNADTSKDHEYTDWRNVTAFAKAFSAKVAGVQQTAQ